MVRSKLAMPVAGALMLLAGCVAPVEVSGPGLSPAALGGSELTLAAAPGEQVRYADAAQQAVEAALSASGFTAADDARARVITAFSVAPHDVRIDDGTGSRDAPISIALCKRQRYVLSVAVTDRVDGRLLFRNRASTVRCGKAPEEVLPSLAGAAIQGI